MITINCSQRRNIQDCKKNELTFAQEAVQSNLQMNSPTEGPILKKWKVAVCLSHTALFGRHKRKNIHCKFFNEKDKEKSCKGF